METQGQRKSLFPENDWCNFCMKLFYHQLHETQAADQSRGSHPCEKVSHQLFSADKPEHEQILMFPSFSAAYSAFSRLTGSAWKRHWRAVIFRPAGWAYVRLIAPETRWQTGRLRISGGSEFEGFTKNLCFQIEAHRLSKRLTNDILCFQSQQKGESICLP